MIQFSILFCIKDELEAVRARLEKAEKERTSLKYDNEKMEARVSVPCVCMCVCVCIYVCVCVSVCVCVCVCVCVW